MTIESNALKSKVGKILKSIPEFLTEENQLKLNVIKLAAEKGDPRLLGELMKNKEMKKVFFTPVLDSFVFNSGKFKEILEYGSAYNSYSKYLGKEIGLYMGDEAITERNEVVLNFPFKDCILEGGQTKDGGMDIRFEWDETKKDFTENVVRPTKNDKYIERREVFYNEVLAHDEIDSLFSPKALCNGKRYENERCKKCTSFTRDVNINRERDLPDTTITDNLIIKGNNLLALHSLKKEFAGKVKLIYIDPPYNTGNDGFKYNDNFNHSSWLTFMKNRLEIARDLLKDDGAIYIQLDYHEVHYAKILMDSIFGRENFQREIIWRIGWVSGFKTSDNNWIRNHDTILFYSKNNILLDFKKKYILRSEFKDFLKSDLQQYPIEDVWNGNEYDNLNSIAIMSFSGETVSKMLNSSDSVKGQKSEKLIQRILTAHTNENDIVLDFFAGTGTTAAVAVKMKRQAIVCEQLDKHIDIIERRLNKVLEGEQSGISKQVNWQGGGSFVYLELAEKNEKAIRLISSCKNIDELIVLFDSLTKKYFLHYNVSVNKFREEVCEKEEFKSLPLEKQKEMFIRMLDLNQLYINADDRYDEHTGLTKEDITLTENFYQL